jgi:AP-1 complex subunit mu
MSGISSIYILDQKGKVLITRAYRADVALNIHEKFNQKLLEFDESTLKPIIHDKTSECVFYFIKYNNLTFLATGKRNSNVTMVFAFLYKFQDVLIEYFKELEEESIRDNFVIIYELLDEMMDNGYPQITETKILQEYIKSESHKMEGERSTKMTNPIDVAIPDTINNVPWRPPGIKHKKNEIFMDVIEKLNMLINASGTVIKSEILGALKMKSFLTGMPELKLGLNDKALFEATGRTTKGRAVELDDIKFHQCVRLTRFENERTISFIPPDGDFELMSYRLDMNVRPLFTVECAWDYKSQTRIEFNVRVKSNYKAKNSANNVEIGVPVPCDAQTPNFKASTGSVNYVPEKESMVWTIKQFGGQKDITMKAKFALPSVKSSERDNFSKTPISINFEIPYFTVSGINVRYLKIVERSGYSALPWVRYITQNGDYLVRMSG